MNTADQSNTSDLLFEIAVEELPAGSLLSMAGHLAEQLHKALADAGFAAVGGPVKQYATPRRLAVLIGNVKARQEDQAVEKRGPAVAAAFDADGNPTKAVQGFARSCGVDVSELERIETPKGEWLIFRSMAEGQSLAAFLDSILGGIIKQIPSPRRMRWSDGEVEFLRPVTGTALLHGSEVLSLEVLGTTTGNAISGHRFHAPGPFTLNQASEYESVLLQQGHVVADFDKRRQRIVESVEQCAASANASVVMDAALVDEVTALVEWPVAVSGTYDEHFLELPKEALIQTMEENQKYFALVDGAGNLKPGFVTVSNIDSSNVETVVSGNERVIRPRFADTLFFWEKDSAQKLASRTEMLEKVLFQEKLGSLLDKTTRLESISEYIAGQFGADTALAKRAAHLSKCDLVTDTVGELAKMQGIAGDYMAAADGEPKEVCTALREQYYPIKAGGDLPETTTGRVLAIADKTDTLVGIFGIGEKPSGAKDPFALRRSAIGLLRMLIESEQSLDLQPLFAHAAKTFGSRLNADHDSSETTAFVMERLRSYYQDRGEPHDVIDAVMAKGVTDPWDFHRRVQAIGSFRKTEAAESLSAANKRIQNILKKIDGVVPDTLADEQLTEAAEKILAANLRDVTAELVPKFEQGDYMNAMASTAKLRDSVDDFFDSVMVMVDDEKLRNNRLALLKQVGELCSQTADLSRLQPDAG